MGLIVLDTNVISEIFRPAPEPAVIAWLSSLTGNVAITSITLAELLAGLRRLPAGRRKDNLTSRVEEALEPYRRSRAILPFDDAAAAHYADVLVSRAEAGLAVSTADAQIAAICVANSATCATRNIKDFVHTGVNVINPWETTPVE